MPLESVLESSEERFSIKDRHLLIFLIISECVLTIPSSHRAELTSVVYLKRGLSMPDCSGLQTPFAIDGSAALSVGPITAPPAVNGLCCPLSVQPCLGFDFPPTGRTYSHLSGTFSHGNTLTEMQEGTQAMSSRTRMFCHSV